MSLHYVVSVHMKFLLLGFSCLWVCWPEECFWLDCKASCTVTKLKSSSSVPVVLAACCCFWWYLTAVGHSGVCVPSALWMSSAWEGFPSFSRQAFGLFVNFTFCEQKCIWLFYQYSVLATDAPVAALAATRLLHESVYTVFWLSLEWYLLQNHMLSIYILIQISHHFNFHWGLKILLW